MTSLPTRVAKLLAFDEKASRQLVREVYRSVFNDDPPFKEEVEQGLKCMDMERSRTSALEAALVKAVEALTFYREQSNWSEELNKNYSMIIADGGTRAKEALAEITQACERMEGKAE